MKKLFWVGVLFIIAVLSLIGCARNEKGIEVISQPPTEIETYNDVIDSEQAEIEKYKLSDSIELNYMSDADVNNCFYNVVLTDSYDKSTDSINNLELFHRKYDFVSNDKNHTIECEWKDHEL